MRKVFVYLLMSLQPLIAVGQKSKSQIEKPKILIVGVYHFDNPRQDVFNPKVDDMLAEKRQQEIAQVLELLKVYRPTKVALEARANPKTDSMIQQYYKEHLQGTRKLAADEVEQLGFRLAKMMGHQKVYCVDAAAEFNFDKVAEFMEQNNMQDKLKEFMAYGHQMTEEHNQQIATQTVQELLYNINKPENIAAQHEIYYKFIPIGKGTNYVGADLVADWYKRNVRIFANLNRIVTSSVDRIILIIGAGHVKYLKDLIEDAPNLEYVDASEYLKPAKAKKKQQFKRL